MTQKVIKLVMVIFKYEITIADHGGYYEKKMDR